MRLLRSLIVFTISFQKTLFMRSINTFRLFVFGLVLASAMSCNHSRTDNVVFPKEVLLKAEKVQLHEIIDIADATIIADKFVTLSYKADTVFHVFSLPDMQLINKFGIRGQGPNDLNLPFFVKNNSDRLLALDFPNRLKEFNINFETDDPPVFYTHRLSGLFDNSNVFLLNDSLLFHYSDIASNISVLSYNINKDTDLFVRNLDVPESHGLSWAYQNLGLIAANNQSVVYAYQYKNSIDFMEHDFRMIKTVTKNKSAVHINIEHPDDNKMEYMRVYSGVDKFYFLYQGCSINERAEKQIFKSIEVYDSEGNPLIRYQLDSNPYGFVVDETNSTIYAWGEDDDVILKYDMSINESCSSYSGSATELRIEITPDEQGLLRKTVSVYGNMDNAPI